VIVICFFEISRPGHNLRDCGHDCPRPRVDMPQFPVYGSLAEIDISLAEIDISLAEIDISLAKIDISFAEIDISFAKIDISFAKIDVSLEVKGG
jgi:hypothetical protein